MFNVSKELIIILVIVLVIFGPKQLPQLGKMLGKTMREIRQGMEEPAGEADAAPKRRTPDDSSDDAE